ncbi:hypothetical protein [Craterilacuibacter sp.]|uniref:hypothetical protein n=1 Tax=Craterilacuibacter sp. TaxID=2870909 RepID=UPI003F35BA37
MPRWPAQVVSPRREASNLGWSPPVWAVFYKQGALAPRIAAFVDYLAQHLAERLK